MHTVENPGERETQIFPKSLEEGGPCFLGKISKKYAFCVLLTSFLNIQRGEVFLYGTTLPTHIPCAHEWIK
jgi:hypothetical protein